MSNTLREALEAILAKPSDDLNDATEDADGYFRTPYRRAEIAARAALAADDAARGMMREQFEAWAAPLRYEVGHKGPHGEYLGQATQIAWSAWQAASRAAAPQPAAQPEPICRTDGRCQYAIDHGAEGLGHCPQGKCAMPEQPAPGVLTGGNNAA